MLNGQSGRKNLVMAIQIPASFWVGQHLASWPALHRAHVMGAGNVVAVPN